MALHSLAGMPARGRWARLGELLTCRIRGHDYQERGCGAGNAWGLQEDTVVECRRCSEPYPAEER